MGKKSSNDPLLEVTILELGAELREWCGEDLLAGGQSTAVWGYEGGQWGIRDRRTVKRRRVVRRYLLTP